jgi:hypothetical protein
MTLREQITEDVNAVFLNTEEFAKRVWWYPNGEDTNKKRINIIDISDQLEGTREVAGDGRVLDRRDGVRVRRSSLWWMSVKYAISEQDGKQGQDWFDDDGAWLVVKRVVSRDHAMQKVLVIEVDQPVTRVQQRHG